MKYVYFQIQDEIHEEQTAVWPGDSSGLLDYRGREKERRVEHAKHQNDEQQLSIPTFQQQVKYVKDLRSASVNVTAPTVAACCRVKVYCNFLWGTLQH